MNTPDDLNKELGQHLFKQLLSAQNEGMRPLLEECECVYEAASGSLVLSSWSDNLAKALIVGQQFLSIPELLSRTTLKISSPSIEDVITGGKAVIELAKALSAAEAISFADNHPEAVGICLFQDNGIRPVYVNDRMSDFVGQSNAEILSDQPALLFLPSADAVNSLNELEKTLIDRGEVKNFELISKRSNGEYGRYLIDAYYVNWAGMKARITVYYSFAPISVR